MLGPNGAGKTTAVRILTTLADADEGEAVVAGFDVAEDPKEVRRRIGLAAQDATVDPLLTGRENLIMLGELHQLGRKEAGIRADGPAGGVLPGRRRRPRDLRLLRRHAPPPRPGRHPRVSTPRCSSSTSPPPASTPGPAAELWAVLDHLVDRGTTLLLTTQYLDEAERLADDIIVIDHGRIIARGDARKLKREVGGDHLQVVVVDPARLDDAARLVAEVTGLEPRVDVGARRVTAPTSQGVDTLVEVAKALAGGGDRRRRPQPAPAHARRGVPDPHRGRPRDETDEEDAVVTATTVTDVSAGRTRRDPDERVLPEPRGVLHDTWVIARRGLIHMKRQPEALSDATIQPIMFVLLFGYVFGGAIDVPAAGATGSS